MQRLATCCLVVVLFTLANILNAEPLRVGIFDVDASPPIGSPMAYDPTDGVQMPLSCRGIVLVGAGKPIVLCAVDWIGIGNDSQREFKAALAEAAGTDASRIAVHTLHQHDAPRCDFTADQLLAPHGINTQFFDTPFARDVIARTAKAVGAAVTSAKTVTHVGLGEGKIEKVASNRRVLGEDGKVKYVRYTATKNPVIRAAPVGTIDPMLKMISLWSDDKPIVALTYYATHPQSYYRTGLANPDFPGMARNARDEATGTPHIHFNGAGGNIGAGKWNDGAKENRQVLADRVAAGMKLAWEAQKKTKISADDVGWSSVPVKLPCGKHLDADALQKTLENEDATANVRSAAASNLAWVRRCELGSTIDISCLRIGKSRVLHMPGELFVEYQLAAQAKRPDLFVAMAAYGDYGPGYIGTTIAYGQGGYETSDRATRVAPQVEAVLTKAVDTLLAKSPEEVSNLHLFLLVGQSNMAGRGKVGDADRQTHDRILMLNREGKWVPATDPLHFDKPNIVGVGLGKTFALDYVEKHPDATVGLIPCAVGGSPIAAWEPGGYHPSTKTHPYDDAIPRAKAALKSGELKGILWHQGESDSKPKWARVYEEKLHALIARFRKELNSPDVPFIAGQMGQFEERPWNDDRKQVDAAHRSLPEKVNRTAFANSNGLSHKGDEVHFDTKSYHELGHRYFKAFESATTK